MNGKKVNIASYQVKPGDVISVKEASRQLETVLVASQLAERDVPDYLEVDHGKMTARLTPVRASRCSLRDQMEPEPRGRVLLALTLGQTPGLSQSRSGGFRFFCPLWLRH